MLATRRSASKAGHRRVILLLLGTVIGCSVLFFVVNWNRIHRAKAVSSALQDFARDFGRNRSREDCATRMKESEARWVAEVRKRDEQRDRDRDARRDKKRDQARDKERDKKRDKERDRKSERDRRKERKARDVERDEENEKITDKEREAEQADLDSRQRGANTHPDAIRLTPSYYMIVMVMCHADNRAMRDAQRHSWMRYPIMFHRIERPHAPVRAFFVVGTRELTEENITTLKQEEQSLGDLVLVDSDDGPHNRKFTAFLHWLEDSGAQYAFFAKVDTDTYLRPQVLVEDIKRLHMNSKSLYYGNGWTDTFDLCGQESVEVFFHTGSTVVLSSDILRFIARQAPAEVEDCAFTEDVRTGFWVQVFSKHTKTNVSTIQTETFCHLSQIIPGSGHRCVSFHLGLTKPWAEELFTWLFDRMPRDGHEEELGTFPWGEFYKTALLRQNEHWIAKEKRENKSYAHEIWVEKKRKRPETNQPDSEKKAKTMGGPDNGRSAMTVSV